MKGEDFRICIDGDLDNRIKRIQIEFASLYRATAIDIFIDSISTLWQALNL